MRARVDRWLTDSPLNLAVFRVTVGALIASLQGVHQLAVDATRVPMAVRTAPWGWGWMLRAVPISPAVAEALRAALTLAALCGALGLFSRASFAVVTVAGMFLWAHAMTLGSAVHFHHLLWFAALLAASPCGDALSLDRWRARRGLPSPAPHRAYGIPLRAAWLLVGAVYFFPGLWKLATSGAAWFLSDNLLLQMRAKWTQMEGFTPLFRVDRHPWLCRAGALATVAFELSFVLLVIPRRTRPLAVGAALLFHQATDWFMGLRYPALWVCYTAFVDWDALLSRWRGETETVAVQRDTRLVTAVSAALLAGAMALGAMGESDAWPFACYPKFDRIVGATLPAMEVALVYEGREVAVPARAMFPAGRTQRYWALTWSLLGAHRSERASARRFGAFWRSAARQPSVRSMVPGARSVRFYRATISTDPDLRDAPPLRRALLAELPLTDARR